MNLNYQERVIAEAGATLRLVRWRGAFAHPPGVLIALSHAHRLAKDFCEWRESKIPIGDICVRLSDQQEVVVKRAIINHRCNLSFILRIFEAGEVIHICKKADGYYGEVELLSISVDDIRPEGFTYQRRYDNGQLLLLSVQHYPDGRLHFSMDFTLVEEYY